MDDKYGANFNRSLSILVSSIEKLWLKNILQDEKVNLFIKEETKEKLNKALEDIPNPLNEDSIIIKNQAYQDTSNIVHYKEVFRLILKVINDKNMIQYNYKSLDGSDYINKRAIPYKIEYSLKDDKFYLLLYSTEENRPIRSILSRIYDVEIIEEEEDSQKYFDSVQQKKAKNPIVLYVKDERNALERVFFAFSSYETKRR